jgi:hypothetical protein
MMQQALTHLIQTWTILTVRYSFMLLITNREVPHYYSYHTIFYNVKRSLPGPKLS